MPAPPTFSGRTRRWGKTALWQIDPATGVRTANIPLTLVPGFPWTASSFYYVDTSTAYILWTHPTLGKTALWQIDPATGVRTANIPLTLVPGFPWTASSFYYVDTDTGYILWTHPTLGKTALWQIDPATGARTANIPLTLVPGSPWVATGFEYVDTDTGYILWTHPTLGKTALWQLNPTTGERTANIPLTLVPGSPWMATSFFYSSEAGAGSSMPDARQDSSPVASETVVIRKAGMGRGTLVTEAQTLRGQTVKSSC